VDRSSQETPDPAGGAESPLSFPVEAPRPVGLEPGGGAPLAGPVRFPAEDSRSAPSPSEPPPTDPAQGSRPPQFPGEAPAPTEAATVLPYPVAQLPGAPAAAEPPQPLPGPQNPVSAPPVTFLRFAAPVLAAVAAVLTAFGVFSPLFVIREELGALDAHVLITETAWGHTFVLTDQEVTDQAGAPVGAPLLIAAILLAVAALVVFTQPHRPLGRSLVAAGAVFAAGAVVTVAMSGIGWAVAPESRQAEVTTGPGMWLLFGGVAAAAAAAVLAYLPRREQPGWADPAVAYADTPTPPSGVAITVLPPEEPGDPGLR